MHRLATVHARDNQPTTNDQRRHDTAYLNKRLLYLGNLRRLKTGSSILRRNFGKRWAIFKILSLLPIHVPITP